MRACSLAVSSTGEARLTSGHEILTVAESGEADRAAVAAGVDSFDLMRRAGEAVAAAVAARWSPRPVLVLCGPGLNGGDGWVAAARLAALGWPVRVAARAEPSAGDARRARALWPGPVEPFAPAAVAGAKLVVGALFGAGLSRPLENGDADLLRAVESAGLPIVAVDLPSGQPGDLAQPSGYAPTAALTVTFHRKKPAHVLEPARDRCGAVSVADIGIPAAATPAARLFENHPDLWLDRFPWPSTRAHKHQRGRLGVVTGDLPHTGAARLAARAGLRAGAGLVRLYCPPEAVTLNAPHLEAVMLQPFDGDTELEQLAQAMDAVVIGPAAGVNDQTVANLFALARTGAALIIDADALTVFRDDPEELFGVLDRDDVLTPHEGEFDRVFPNLLKEAPERITAARRAAERAGAVMLLKGPDTVVAAPDGRAAVSTNGTPWLATAGSGDVLTGIVGAAIAQGMDSFDAACAGVWLHAEAGSRFGPGLIAEDLPEQLPAVLRELYARSR